VLTLVGIAIAITTVVALGVVTTGMKSTADDFVTSGGADFLVAQEGAADLSFSTLPEDIVTEIAAQPDVASVRGALLHVTTAGSNPFFFLSGVEHEALASQELDLVAGRLLEDDDERGVLLGEKAADDLSATVGSTVEIGDASWIVIGVYRSEGLWEASGGIAGLADLQEVAQKPDTVTIAFVTVTPGASPTVVADRIEQAVPAVVTIADADEYSKVDQGFVLVDAANVAISLLAVVIGGIGVMNTMIMSVFERTREIGILRAVGWTGRRVMRMVLLESLLLCIAAAVVGALVGVAVTRLVLLAPAVQGFLDLAYTPDIFVRAVVVALIVGLVGASYPAWRATRLSPMEALRYE
jgi:putative ABC transport system permease protein